MRSVRLALLLSACLLALPTTGLGQTVATGNLPPTTATKVVEVPGATYKLRLYAKGQYGWYITTNASTDRGEIWLKDDPAVNSQVVSISAAAEMRLAFDNDPRSSSWTAGKRWVRWIGSVPQWRIGTSKDFPIYACSHTGTAKAARVGDVLHFSVAFPVAFDTTPTGFTWSTDASAAVDLSSLAVRTIDAYHVEASINVQADGDAYWVGCLAAG